MGLKWGQIYFLGCSLKSAFEDRKIDLSPFKPHLSPLLQDGGRRLNV